jgi:hypothetical protein
MSLLVPDDAEVLALQEILNNGLVLKLYSNNIVPAETDVAGTYTEVSGGGYASVALPYVGWTISSGDPSYGLFAQQVFTFTGATAAPSTIYGYYVIDNLGNLRWAERFVESILPFVPIKGSTIKITPRFEAS